MDLSLVPIEDLLKEAERRCSVFVVGMEMDCGDEQGSEIKTMFGKGSYLKAVGISEILKNDCLNDWNGELRVLQRLTEENGSCG